MCEAAWEGPNWTYTPSSGHAAAGFPLTSLEARLKCPMCGSRKVSVIFDVPSEPAAMRIAGMPSR